VDENGGSLLLWLKTQAFESQKSRPKRLKIEALRRKTKRSGGGRAITAVGTIMERGSYHRKPVVVAVRGPLLFRFCCSS